MPERTILTSAVVVRYPDSTYILRTYSRVEGVEAGWRLTSETPATDRDVVLAYLDGKVADVEVAG